MELFRKIFKNKVVLISSVFAKNHLNEKEGSGPYLNGKTITVKRPNIVKLNNLPVKYQTLKIRELIQKIISNINR